MVKEAQERAGAGPRPPLWIPSPRGAAPRRLFQLAALVFTGQNPWQWWLTGSDWPTALLRTTRRWAVSSSLVGGNHGQGLVVTSAASFARHGRGPRPPLSVVMMAVLSLVLVHPEGKAAGGRGPAVGGGVLSWRPFMTVGGFRGGAIAGVAALFSARGRRRDRSPRFRIYRDHWWTLVEIAETAICHPRGSKRPAE